jgi:hypothetical protein
MFSLNKLALILTGLASFLCLEGCAESTGILPAGPDTYIVTERFSAIRGGSETAQKAAMTDANQYCLQNGLQFDPLQMAQLAGMTTPVPTGYTVTFRCLKQGDPELQRPNYEPAPNVVVEQRND